MKKVVILGAGYTGVLVAKKLAKRTKKAGNVEVTLVDKHPFHTMLTELHEVAAQRVENDSIRISLERVFAGRNVKLVHDTITKVDTANNRLTGEHGAYDYDYLVMASGCKPAFFGTPGAEEHAYTLWSFEDATRLRDQIEGMFRDAAMEPDVAKKKEMLTFYVVGAGFTGVEMVGELAELAPFLAARYEIDRELLTIVNVDMLDRACTVLPEKLSEKVHKRLHKMGVTTSFKTSIKGVGADYIEFDAGKGLERAKTRTVIWTAGVEGSEIAQASGDLGAAGRGRIQTDEFLRSQNNKNVYVGGDNIFFIPEGEKGPVPQMIENAEASADNITHNLMTDLTGTGEKKKYAPKSHGVMVCVGGRWGTANVGTVNHKMPLPSFLAMFSKHFINLIYFIQVLGWNKIFSYFKHEFFTVRNKRSFLGGHFSNRGPSFLLAPLRLFLGVYWVYQAFYHIGEGWLKNPALAKMINGTQNWYWGVLGMGGTASSGAADAAAAATGAAEAAADVAASASGVAEAAATTVAAVTPVIFNINWLGLARTVLLGGNAPEEIAFWLNVPLMDWMLKPMLASDGLQMFMQWGMILAMFGVGLALMGGLFTTIVSTVSFAFMMMFLSTTGLYMTSWWIPFASIAMMFGAGQAFSLDYYVMPWLKKHWKNAGIAKKSYLYHD